jgi:hypothetical protein
LRHFSFFILNFALALLAACGNPRAGGSADTGAAPPENTPRARPAVTLRPLNKAGDQFRTTRRLHVEELTETERYLTESEETTLTEVLRVDDSGRLLSVRRSWEASFTRLTHGYGKGEEARGALDGSVLELTQKAGGVDVKRIAGEADIRGANFLIEGFDTGLLPLDPVREGDYWQLEGSRLGGLNVFIEAMQFKIEKNKLTCQLANVTPEQAEISLEWRISGELQGAAAVLVFRGELLFDRKVGMISSFHLKGGRDGRDGTQIEISISRRPVEGWLDLDK